ncbi:hypothetical protein AVEN_222353-1 [Araneus ventricosus]|uniref:Uncharacterized protein n=1 Tax=Araneus ventricosus TaxID=182803 RepID=A0A4Y2LB31_ARAVE|nr:hypothetical protein AVEN_222353-1 [Araneus ventricosus]
MQNLTEDPLSLKDLPLRRLSAILWVEPDILSSLSTLPQKHGFSDIQIPQVKQETPEEKISNKLSKLVLPMSLTKQINDTIKQMGMHLRDWKVFHRINLNFHDQEIRFDESVLEKVQLTSEGAVDYRKTAEELIRSDVMDVSKRYKLACLYCLEDYIPLFWKDLPAVNKDQFYTGWSRMANGFISLKYWWPHIIEGEESVLESLTRTYRREHITVQQYGFEFSVEKSNKCAAEYFFEKLTHGQKEESLIHATKALLLSRNSDRSYHSEHFPLIKVSEMLWYLLSQMNPDQKMGILQEHPCNVLKRFLIWPLQDHFCKVACIVFNYLPESDYDTVLKEMYKGKIRKADFYYQTLFEEFFQHIPYNFRKNFVSRQCESGSYLDRTLKMNDVEALRVTFRSVDAATKIELLSSELAFKRFHSFISREKRDVMEVCLREARLSKEDRERLEEAFIGYLTSTGVAEMKLKTRKFSKFTLFPDEVNAPTKRCSEGDDTLTESKAEVAAIDFGVRRDLENHKSINIHIGSQSSIESLRSPRPRSTFVISVKNFYMACDLVGLDWVKAHVCDPSNELVDRHVK